MVPSTCRCSLTGCKISSRFDMWWMAPMWPIIHKISSMEGFLTHRCARSWLLFEKERLCCMYISTDRSSRKCVRRTARWSCLGHIASLLHELCVCEYQESTCSTATFSQRQGMCVFFLRCLGVACFCYKWWVCRRSSASCEPTTKSICAQQTPMTTGSGCT